jgi:LuxR family maltose regulon positive regulatory protein
VVGDLNCTGVGRVRVRDPEVGVAAGVATAVPAEPLLTSKLAVPPPPGGVVERPRLHSLLDAGTRGPVTVLVAPAGWGKTVLLSAWAPTAGGPVGWLSLEPADTGERFWWYLHGALTMSGLADPLPPPRPHAGTGYLTQLAEALAGQARPVVLVLDDLHHVRDPAVTEGLDFLLRHAGSGLRLVVSGRSEPELPLHRWRLRDELMELRTDELSFTPAETRELFARHDLDLPGPALARLRARTEGWPAGLRFAALSLPEHPDPIRFVDRFAGDDPRVAGYLTGEVLGGLPTGTRDALLDASILERMCGPLVDALTGRGDGDALLTGLERAGGFMLPLDARPGWYRPHRMLGELLRAELGRRAPERVPELHRRAARWHAEQGLPADALRHALAGQDWGYATRLLVTHRHHLARYGHDEPLPAPVPPPPVDAIRADPELALAYAADRLDLRDLDVADGYLRLADRHRHLLAADRQDRFGLIATALQLAQAQQRGDAAQVRSAATGMLALLGEVEPVWPAAVVDPAHPAPPAGPAAGGAGADRDAGAAAVALTALGTAELSDGDLAAAEAALTDGLVRAEVAGLSCARLVCASALAFVQAARGQLRAAERTARAALGAPPCPGQARSVHRGYAHLALAMADLQGERPDAARAELDLAAASEPGGDPELAAAVAIVAAQLRLDEGDLAAGYELLRAGRREVADRPPSRLLERWFAGVEADLRTAHGDTGTARRMLAPLADDPMMAVPLARAHLCEDDPAGALRALSPVDSTVDGSRPGGELPLGLRVEAGVIEALAARRAGDARTVTRALERALTLAETEGYRRPFTRAGSAARELLVEHLDSGTACWSLVNELVAAADDRPVPAAPPAPAPPTLAEPLTERELTILRYLQSILSNTEIAVELSLSVNTVKTHVRNIYRKLDAARRRDAVRRARELHLL